MDNFTFRFKDSAWVSLKLKAVGEESAIVTYQYDSNHCSDGVCANENEWGEIGFVHGEMETLQQKTNGLILILTVVTVIESVFGMRETIKFSLGLLYQPLSYIAEFLGTVIK